MAVSDMFFMDAAGLHIPDFPSVLEYFREETRAQFGEDVYIAPDSMLGIFLAVYAQACFDCAQAVAAVNAGQNPLTAFGDSLSRNVKINGISRLVPSHSTVDLRIVGQAGTIIQGGQAEDEFGQKWILPEEVTIPVEGEITVTATAAQIGAIRAQAHSIQKIATPTRGWQTVDNPAAANTGRAVETDAELRQRQTRSTMIPSQTVMDGIVGAVAAVDGVTRARGYENDTGEEDSHGIPGHTFAIVAEGGDAQAIGDAIAKKKTAGAGTYGTTTVTTYDKFGTPCPIRFSRPIMATVAAQVTLTARAGYSANTADNIKEALASYISGLNIGENVLLSKLYTPANLAGLADTFDITSIRLSKNGGAYAENSVAMGWNELAQCSPSDILVTVQ